VNIQGASPKSGQISISIFRYIMPPSEVVVGVRKYLMLLVKSYSQNGRDVETKCGYNRRAAIEGLRAERLESNGNNSILWIHHHKINCLWRCSKIYGFRKSNESSNMPVRKSHSKEHTMRIPAVVVRIQTLISDDAEQSLRVLMDIVKPWMETVASRRHPVFQQDSAPTHTSHSKLTLRQRRYVLVQGILASQQPRFKSLGLLRMERSWKGHKQVSMCIPMWRH